MPNSRKSTNETNYEAKQHCPYCGFNGYIGAFCPNCGKRIKEPKSSTLQASLPKAKSNFSRTVLIGMTIIVAVAIVATALIVGTLVLFPPSNNNLEQPNPTPTATPTLFPTPTATLTPTLPPSSTQIPISAQTLQITGVDLQIQYKESDQGYFGPVSQSASIDNQPGEYLIVEHGQQFIVYFILNAPTSGTESDSITNVTVSTPGFTIVSVEPQLPIAFSTGESKQIAVTLLAPQTWYAPALLSGPIELVLHTSG